MKRKGWLAMMFAGAIVVNGLILFAPPLSCAQNQSAQEKIVSQQGEEAGERMTGMINSFDGEDTIVISDMTFHFSKRTRFYNKYGTSIPASRLKIDEYVDFLSVNGSLEEVRQIDLKDVEAEGRLPLQDDSGDDGGTVTEQNNDQGSPMHLEDGVWKN